MLLQGLRALWGIFFESFILVNIARAFRRLLALANATFLQLSDWRERETKWGTHCGKKKQAKKLTKKYDKIVIISNNQDKIMTVTSPKIKANVIHKTKTL